MNKKVFNQALKRSGGVCEMCQSNDMVELHHIIYGQGKRTQCERIESVIMLCYEHHKGEYGIHGLNMELRKKLQHTYFSMGLTEEEVRKWMGGRLY